MPTCPSPFVWMDGGPFIKFYDPSQALSATNPGTINVPTFGGGLTLMPNINGGTLSPTFYSVSGGTYWYWNGAAWVNTGHGTGNAAAVNLGGCNSAIYNLVGGSGQVYVYNGTGSGTLLTTLAGFNGGGPYDLVADCNCNFYALNTTTPNQNLTMYSPNGTPLCTYSMSGMPNTSAGGGFAIIGNTIYVKNNLANGFFIGNIAGSSITFTQVMGFTASPGDFASCPVCYPAVNFNNVSITSAVLACSVPTVNIIVTTNTVGASFSWSGPGIVGPTNGSVVVANAPGIYSCVVSAGGCPPAQMTLTTSIGSNTSVVLASITPSGNICTTGNGQTQLVVAHSFTSDVITWSGPGIVNGQGTGTILLNAPGIYSVAVTDISNGCVGTSTVQIAPTPSLNISLSSPTVCANNFNGSLASLTLTPGGASNYTLLASQGFSTSSPNGTIMPCFPIAPFSFSPFVATATLLGSNGFCSSSTSVNFTIIPNPTVNITPSPASMCPYSNVPFAASGASNYTWSGGAGLNVYFGNAVVATPTISTTYFVVGEDSGCYSTTKNVSLTVLPIPLISVSPLTSTICLGSSLTLTASGTSASFAWSPPGGIVNPTSSVIIAYPVNSGVFNVIGTLNTCTNSASASVTVVQPPVLNIASSSNSVCAFNYNGSPNSISLIPSGANNYTLLGGSDFLVGFPNGPNMQLVPTVTPQAGISVGTATLFGQTSVCTVSITKTFSIINNPTISVSPSSASMCPYDNRVFTASGAGSYTWAADPTATLLNNATIKASPPFTQFYSVLGSSLGCNSLSKNAILLVLPIPNVAVSPVNGTICSGSSATLIASGNASLYTWTPPLNLSSTVGTSVVANPFQTQVYTVLATLNTCTNSAVATVSAIPVPVITASATNYTVCSGANTNLTAFGAWTYSWVPNIYLNNNLGASIISSPNEKTTYTVHGYNGICTGATTIQVHTVKRPDMTLECPENQICLGATLPITVRGAQNYSWAPMESILILGSNSVVTVFPRANTNYTVFGTTSQGTITCYQQLSYSVMVVNPIVAKVSESISICHGEKVTLSSSGGNTYSWNPSNGLNAINGAAVVAGPTVSTVYSVHVSHDTYCGSTATVFVEVNPKPLVFAGKDTTYNLSEPIFIVGSGTGTLSWVSGEAIQCKVCPITQVYPTGRSCYVLEARNDYGCAARDEVCIEITEDFSVYIPNVFTPNKDGSNDVFFIYGENINSVSMEIFDRWGIKMFSSKDQAIGWDGTNKGVVCPDGIYIYDISFVGLNNKRYTKTGHLSLVR